MKTAVSKKDNKSQKMTALQSLDHPDGFSSLSEDSFVGADYNALVDSSELNRGHSHFQFQSEKLWTLTDKPLDSRFVLNIQSLAENLSSMSFHERLLDRDDHVPKYLPSVTDLYRTYMDLREKRTGCRQGSGSKETGVLSSSSSLSSELGGLKITNSNEKLQRANEEANNRHTQQTNSLNISPVDGAASSNVISGIPCKGERTPLNQKTTGKPKTKDLENWLDSILDE